MPTAHRPLPSFHPISLLSRSFASRSGLTTSRLINPRSGRDAFDIQPEAASSTRDTARRMREKDEARVEERARRQLPFNAYNRDLIHRVKAAEDWVSLLRMLTPELSSTSYNVNASQRWVSPNKKHEQLTVSAAMWMVLRLIKLRGTRRRALEDDRLMQTLHALVVLVETMAPKMHNEAGVWRQLHEPYLYLRRQVELWREGKEEQWRLRQRVEEERRVQADSKAKGVVTDTEMREQLAQAAKQRKAAAAASPSQEGKEQPAPPRRTAPTWAERLRGAGDEEEEVAYARMSRDEKMKMQLAYLLEREQRGTEEYLQARQQQQRRKEGRPASDAEDEEEEGEEEGAGKEDRPRGRRKSTTPSYFT